MAMNQSSSVLILRAWKETCHFFIEYLRKSPSSPFQKVAAMFARHEFQKDIGNLPHIHAMIKIAWEALSQSQREFLDELICASILEIVRPEEVQRFIEHGLLKSLLDLKGVIQNASKIFPHRCNERCLIAVGPNEYRCRKLNFLLTNRPPNNTRSVMKELPNDLSIDCLRKLERAEIVEPLDINAETGYMKPFKSNLQFFSS